MAGRRLTALHMACMENKAGAMYSWLAIRSLLPNKADPSIADEKKKPLLDYLLNNIDKGGTLARRARAGHLFGPVPHR